MQAAQSLIDSNDNVVAGAPRGPRTGAPGITDEAVAALLPHGPVVLAAEGGMALVYRGHDAENGCPVAIKVLRTVLSGHAEIIDSFVAEHDIVRRIAHPGVVSIHARGEVHGVPYLVMDWCAGQTLADIVAFQPMGLRRVTTVGAQLASMLAAAHEVNVVHCDLKPENILLCEDTGEVRLIDFGVARRTDLPPIDTELVAGTPSYMAPEQWLGTVCPASDVYSLGCVLYELLTGAPPFHGNFAELMIAHRRQAPPSLDVLRPGLAAPLVSLVMAMLSKEPAHRPTTATVASRLVALGARPRRTAAGGHTLPGSHAVPALQAMAI